MNDFKLSPLYLANSSFEDETPRDSQKKIRDLFKRISLLFNEAYNQFSDYAGNKTTDKINKSKNYFHNVPKFFKKKHILPAGLVVVAVIAVYILAVALRSNGTSTVLGDADQRISIQNAKAKQDINKEFLFPLKNEKGIEVSRIKYIIQNAQLQDEIVVKGQRATAVKGRTFLIVYIKITNDYAQDISLKTRDYMRLTVNGNNEKLAPDVHNDPVDIQAISTKYTRLGFPINDTDKDLTLLVGEINGKKEMLKLNLN